MGIEIDRHQGARADEEQIVARMRAEGPSRSTAGATAQQYLRLA